MFENSLTM